MPLLMFLTMASTASKSSCAVLLLRMKRGNSTAVDFPLTPKSVALIIVILIVAMTCG